MREQMRMIGLNIGSLFWFEIIYRTLFTAFIMPMGWLLITLVMHFTGYSYVTKENIKAILVNPYAIIAMSLILLVISMGFIFEFGTGILILDQSYHGNKIHVLDAVKYSLQNLKRALKAHNIVLILFSIVADLCVNIGVVIGYIGTIRIPEVVIKYLNENRMICAKIFLVILIFFAIWRRFLFLFHYFTIEKCELKDAIKKSTALDRKNSIKDIVSIILIQLLTLMCFVAMVAIVVAISVGINRMVDMLEIPGIVSSAVIWSLLNISIFVMFMVSGPFCYTWISCIFYSNKARVGEKCRKNEITTSMINSEKARKIVHVCSVFVLLMALCVCGFNAYYIAQGKIGMKIEYVSAMQVTAHRGASREFPENTMSAFERAVELDADWIELDVQQSRDGYIFVQHDSNFKRTTGMNKNVWELDYEEIAKLDAGKYLGKRYEGEKIPLLSEVIDFAKENNVRLNIEIKPNGHEQNFCQGVIEIIEEKEFKENCVVTSQNYEILKKIKEYDEEITTVYVMSIAYGDITRLKAADNFSVECSSITKSLVTRIHNSGKEIYAWTIDSKYNINRMIELNVDNIITDNVELAKTCVFDSMTSDIIHEYIKIIY